MLPNQNDSTDLEDPSDLPTDIEEFVEKMHKAQRESRPDENWRIKAAERPESVAPYKQDEESDTDDDMPESSVLGQLRSLGVPQMASGGIIPGDEDLQMQESPMADGAAFMPPVSSGGNAPISGLAPSNAGTTPQGQRPIVRGGLSPQGQNPAATLQSLLQSQGANAPSGLPPTPPSGMAMPPAPPPAAQNGARGTIAASSPDFLGKANKLLGLDPQQQAGFLKLLGDNAQKAQLGAGIAGIGDAIASGGTLGKVNPGALHSAEEQIQGRTREGLEGMQTLRANQKEDFELGQTLRGNEPFSPEIQKSLVTQFHIPPALSGAPRDVIYKMLDPIAQTQLKEAELASQQSFKKATLDLQKQQLDATMANQQAERRAGDIKNKLEHPVMSALGMIPSAVPDGRVTVVSPDGQTGHIPATQLKTAMAKGYKQK